MSETWLPLGSGPIIPVLPGGGLLRTGGIPELLNSWESLSFLGIVQPGRDRYVSESLRHRSERLTHADSEAFVKAAAEGAEFLSERIASATSAFQETLPHDPHFFSPVPVLEFDAFRLYAWSARPPVKLSGEDPLEAWEIANRVFDSVSAYITCVLQQSDFSLTEEEAELLRNMREAAISKVSEQRKQAQESVQKRQVSGEMGTESPASADTATWSFNAGPFQESLTDYLRELGYTPPRDPPTQKPPTHLPRPSLEW